MHEYDSRLPDWSPAARSAAVSAMRQLREQLGAELRDAGIDADTAALSAAGITALGADAALLDLWLAAANLDVRLAEESSGRFTARNPSLFTGEAIFAIVGLMIRDFAPAESRARSIRDRLDVVPVFLASMRNAMQDAVPNRWAAHARRECRTADGLFSDGLSAWMVEHRISTPLRREIDLAAARARTAFSECHAWLSLHTGATPDDQDDKGYGCGDALFVTLLQRGHCVDESPRDLLVRADAAMRVAQARLHDLLAGAGTDWPEAQEAMALDHPPAATYLSTFASRWDECREAFTTHNGVTWPDWPIRYVPMPDWASAYAPELYWLFYRSPAPFDAYSTYEYVVTPIDDREPPVVQERRLRAWNHSVITLNHVVHHGGAGHHVQNWHAYHRSRSVIGKIAAVDCANRIGMFLGGSMAEGWACHATALAEEFGLLTALEALSEQHTKVRLLARAIVDLRLHLGDWDFGTCVDFYVRTVGMSRDVATGETTKNSMFPATAIMYWLGSSRIAELRDAMASRADRAFVLREFHDMLLSRGAIPVALAARILENMP